MTTNKEGIENLEVGLGGLQDGMSRLELNIVDKIHQMENNINKLIEVLLSNKEGSSSNTNDRSERTRHNREEFLEKIDGGR